MPITHAFVSSKSQSGDSSIVSKDEWNADHVGALWSPDDPPGSPSAYDDEFNSDLSAWTVLGSLNTSNVTDIPSHWHVVKNTVGQQLHGIYRASAGSTPFTVTCKLTDFNFLGNYSSYGLMIGDSTPTKWYSFGVASYLDSFQESQWTNSTTRSTTTNAGNGYGFSTGRYLRMVVNSSSSADLYSSRNGLVWHLRFTGKNPNLTPAKIGLWVTAEGVQAEAAFDWIRVS